MYKIELPLRIPVSKNRFFTLNLNVYRNAYYQTLNTAKAHFKEQVTSLLEELPKFQKIELEYVLYPGSKRLCDIANICSIVDKFFSDALVESGHLEDDNYTFVTKVTYSFGSIDKLNPRVEVIIKEI